MRKLIKILSIDGGGIRGILPAHILTYLEKRISERTGAPNAKIGDYFDFMAGTSTGGILTCGLLCPQPSSSELRYSASDLMNIFTVEGGKIFKRSIRQRLLSANGNLDEKYSSHALEQILLEYFGNIKLSDAVKPCIITSYEIEKRYAHFFTQHDALTKPGYDYYLRDVARATAAAPTYFEAAKIKSIAGDNYALIDGGVFANNPALCAVSEASKFFSTHNLPVSLNNFAILSLGTGSSKICYPYEAAKNWGAIGWIKPLIDIMMSGVADTVDYQLQQIFQSLGIGGQYLRINPSLYDAKPEIDRADRENISALNDAGEMNVKFYKKQLDGFLDILLDNIKEYHA